MNLRRQWKIEGDPDRGQLRVVNEADYAIHVISDGFQSRHEKLVGWRTITKSLNIASRKTTKVINGAVKRAFKNLGYKT